MGLLEELAKGLKAFECATVYLSGESYVTVSAVPPLVRGLLKSTHTIYDAALVQAFQAVASEETTARWTEEVTATNNNPCIQVIAAALDPRFKKLKFLTLEERFSVQNKVQALAQQSTQGAVKKRNASETDKPLASAERTSSALDSLLDFDSSTDSDIKTSEQDAHQAITNEVIFIHLNNSACYGNIPEILIMFIFICCPMAGADVLRTAASFKD